jgi:hypothetical protein
MDDPRAGIFEQSILNRVLRRMTHHRHFPGNTIDGQNVHDGTGGTYLDEHMRNVEWTQREQLKQ